MSSNEKSTQATTISPKQVLRNHKVIAVVGASKNPEKDAHTVPLYLKQKGYRIIPINPTADRILEEKTYPSLLDLPVELAKQVEVVNVFRPSEELPRVAKEVVKMKQLHGRPLVFWAQLGLESEEAKRILNENQIPYVMNTCIKTVHRLANWNGEG